MKNPDLLAAMQPVAQAFDRLGILYSIGGSVASSAYGFPRSTMDVDMVSNMGLHHIDSFYEMLQPWYYIDKIMIFEAIKNRSSFNIIHLDTLFKIDIFICANSVFDNEVFRRRIKDRLSDEMDSVELYLVSPEDIILHKLLWYRAGGGVSENQWKDIQGVLKVQKDILDRSYLHKWAHELNVADLLDKACRAAGYE